MSQSTSHPKSFWQFSVRQFLILTALLSVNAAMIAYAYREPLKFAAMKQDEKVAGERNKALGQAVSEQNSVLVAEYLRKGADPNTKYIDSNTSYQPIPVPDLCLRNGDMKCLRMLHNSQNCSAASLRSFCRNRLRARRARSLQLLEQRRRSRQSQPRRPRRDELLRQQRCANASGRLDS